MAQTSIQPVYTSEKDGAQTFHLTAEQLRLKLNAAPVGSVFNIGVSSHLPVVEDGVDTGNCFPGYAIVRVGRDSAIKFAQDTLQHLEARGARITLYVNNNFYIVG